jgi:hypothetical protein
VLLALWLAGTALAQHATHHQPQESADSPNLQTQSTTGAKSRPAPPQQIKVGNIVYTVKLVKNVPGWGEYGVGFSGRTCDRKPRGQGGCDVQDHIYLESGRTLKEEQTTLLHELQHAILGIDVSDQKATHHEFIRKLSSKLLAVLQENPELSAYLAASESNVTTAAK